MSVLKKPHILIIEDFEPTATAVQGYLQANGYDVTVIDSHEAAFDRLQSEKSFKPDLILNDFQTTKKMNGLGFLEARQWPMPIIGFASHINDNAYMRFAGAADTFNEKINLTGFDNAADKTLLAMIKAQLEKAISR